MMKSKQKTLILLGTAFFFTLASVGGYVALFFAIKNKTVATTPLTEKIEEFSGREERITSSVSTLRSESTEIEKLSAFFFKESEIVEFTKKVEALGGQSGTELVLESLEQGTTGKSVPYLNFRVTATGDFASVQRLLVLLENFPGKIEWKTVSVTREGVPAPTVSSEGSAPVVSSRTPLWRVDAFLIARNFIL